MKSVSGSGGPRMRYGAMVVGQRGAPAKRGRAREGGHRCGRTMLVVERLAQALPGGFRIRKARRQGLEMRQRVCRVIALQRHPALLHFDLRSRHSRIAGANRALDRGTSAHPASVGAPLQ